MDLEKDPKLKLVEIVIGLRHLLTLVALSATVVFVAGFGWWTLSDTTDLSAIVDSLLVESGAASLVAGPATVQPVVIAAPARQPAIRQMALPPVRKGFKPKPEATGVKGDPNAPVTIVEFSDYQ